MARLRKASRLLRNREAVEAAQRGLFEPEGAVFTIDPAAIFKRRAPLEIELGAGKGEFIIARAATNPNRDFLAIELSAVVARVLASRCGRAGLPNLKVIRMDARPLVNLMLTDGAVSVYHIYFPDPWPKQRHSKHRLFTPPFVTSLGRTLRPDGELHFASDVRDYASEIFAMLSAAGFARLSDDAQGAHSTGFGTRFAAEERAILRGIFRPSGTNRALNMEFRVNSPTL
ncbi:MAG TPA: tRNA (guanosine(46)-N7)-methyltransferase TrmB [Candidatus Binataceae bacterium]